MRVHTPSFPISEWVLLSCLLVQPCLSLVTVRVPCRLSKQLETDLLFWDQGPQLSLEGGVA